jgi:hypothetical protein
MQRRRHFHRSARGNPGPAELEECLPEAFFLADVVGLKELVKELRGLRISKRAYVSRNLTQAPQLARALALTTNRGQGNEGATWPQGGHLTISRPQTTHAPPICTTCQSDLSGKKELDYFCSATYAPVANDDVSDLYEEVSRLVRFLGALAQAGPKAVAQDALAISQSDPAPEWIGNLS